ncbi:MAG: aminodeoxychorismate synthase component I [Desulfobacterales bacterium]|nr:aminodeoxychorismate synthase component I [Desulfobacterales bacterium]
MLKLSEILEKTGEITIEKEAFNLPCSFIDFAGMFAETTGTTVLLSGSENDSSRYDIISSNPFFYIKSRYEEIEVSIDDTTYQIKSDPFETLKIITQHFKTFKDGLPVISGLFGYLSYDLKDMIEKLPRTSVDELELPHMLFNIPTILFIHDKKGDHTTLVKIKRDGKISGTEFDLKEFYENRKKDRQKSFSAGLKGLKSNFSRNEYVQKVDKIKEYIKEGHVYQVNMSQRFKTDFSGNPFSLFKKLYEKNPAPFFSYLNCNDHYIVSTSPERFVTQNGSFVETRPIKGTRPRGKTQTEDQSLRNDLLKSKKDDAELSMIVDLLRNDIGKVCDGGTVGVKEHKKVEAYQNVYHLVSIVEGELAKDKDSTDLIKATFPGGSITGCPKIRSMEIIDELESVRRHIYTGSIGYISFHDTMDFSIAIRTATIINDSVFFSVGGGIVYDSDPDDEYEETLHKGRTFFEAISGEKDIEFEYIWLNGKLVKSENATIPVTTTGFQYGHGFFETILTKNGHIYYLDEHIERLNRAALKFLGRIPDITWIDVIGSVLEKNDLLSETCAIKIAVSKGSSDSKPYDDNFIVTARKYTHRLKLLNKESLDIGVFEFPRHNYLSDFKTMNYMYYYEAEKWAKKNGFDEAVILNTDGSVSETNTANIILLKDNEFVTPVSEHQLFGTIVKKIIECLLKMGFKHKNEKIFLRDISSDCGLILTNSLMGVVPVSSVNRKRVLTSSNLCMELNNMIENKA